MKTGMLLLGGIRVVTPQVRGRINARPPRSLEADVSLA